MQIKNKNMYNKIDKKFEQNLKCKINQIIKFKNRNKFLYKKVLIKI